MFRSDPCLSLLINLFTFYFPMLAVRVEAWPEQLSRKNLPLFACLCSMLKYNDYLQDLRTPRYPIVVCATMMLVQWYPSLMSHIQLLPESCCSKVSPQAVSQAGYIRLVRKTHSPESGPECPSTFDRPGSSVGVRGQLGGLPCVKTKLLFQRQIRTLQCNIPQAFSNQFCF